MGSSGVSEPPPSNACNAAGVNALDAEATHVPPPTIGGLLARLGIVIGSAIVVLGLVVALVVFGPSAAVRSLFVSHHSEWGTCFHFTLSNPCHDLPLSTVKSATGLGLPATTHVVDSAASARVFDGSRNLWALLSFPSSHTSPLADRTTSVEEPKMPLGKKPYSTAVAALRDEGVHDVKAFGAPAASGKSWWAVTGTSRGKTYLYVVGTVQDWNR